MASLLFCCNHAPRCVLRTVVASRSSLQPVAIGGLVTTVTALSAAGMRVPHRPWSALTPGAALFDDRPPTSSNTSACRNFWFVQRIPGDVDLD